MADAQIHDLDGLTPEQVNAALNDGRLQELLEGTEGDGKHEQPEQKDAAWLDQATPEEVRAALKAGQLKDLT